MTEGMTAIFAQAFFLVCVSVFVGEFTYAANAIATAVGSTRHRGSCHAHW